MKSGNRTLIKPGLLSIDLAITFCMEDRGITKMLCCLGLVVFGPLGSAHDVDTCNI